MDLSIKHKIYIRNGAVHNRAVFQITREAIELDAPVAINGGLSIVLALANLMRKDFSLRYLIRIVERLSSPESPWT